MSKERTSTLREDPIGQRWLHICVDMQRLFQPGTEWGLPWMPRVLPNIIALCEVAPERNIFTRFIPAARPGEGQGQWRRYYVRWADMTLERAGLQSIELVDPLQRFGSSGTVIDKPVYSPWLGPSLQQALQERSTDTLVVTGGETDMCVLSTVLGAADWGYRTILVTDALCSASDEAHEAMLKLFSERYSQQVETTKTEELVSLLRDEAAGR